MKKKVLIVIAILFLVGIGVYLVSAYSFHVKVKNQFTGDLEQTDVNDYSLMVEEDIYACFLSDWWKFGGNLNISSSMLYDTEGNIINEYYIVTVPLVKSKNGYVFHVTLGYADENGAIKSVFYELNENMKFTNPDDISSVQAALFEDLKPRIRELYQKVYDMWGILNPDEADT